MARLVAGTTLLALAALGPSAKAAVSNPRFELIGFEYASDHKKALAKADDWDDPRTPAESRVIASAFLGPVVRDGAAIVPLATHT